MWQLASHIGWRWFAAALAKVLRYVLRNSLIRSASFVRSLDFACVANSLQRGCLPVGLLGFLHGTALLMYCDPRRTSTLAHALQSTSSPNGEWFKRVLAKVHWGMCFDWGRYRHF